MRVSCLLAVIFSAVLLRAEDPYTVTARLERAGVAWQVVVVVDSLPPWHVYADNRFAVSIDDHAVKGRCTPPPVSIPDPLGGQDLVFTGRVTGTYALATDGFPVRVRIKHQACSDTSCLPARTSIFLLSPGGTLLATAPTPATAATAIPWLAGVQVKATAAGYLGSSDFLTFLMRARGETTAVPPDQFRQFLDNPKAFLVRQGFIWTLLLVLLGGLLLNLTPCVLPMIPINLAIIGAGARAGSRQRGLALGAAYGAGIAVIYGALGMAVVLTGRVFGALQSSPIFNGALAALFVVLALAMFDLIPIDLSRFQRGGGKGGFWAAGAAGGISALLAGACVAPVVAAVLLLAGSLYQDGNTAAALLPFLLGIGMAFPWPLAGAGLAVLPKPGAWMRWV